MGRPHTVPLGIPAVQGEEVCEGSTCGAKKEPGATREEAGPLTAAVGWINYKPILGGGECRKEQRVVSHTGKIYKRENQQ